jgi:hypothetical protein
MAIDPRARRVLDQKGLELVRARFIKEMAVTPDTDDAMKKKSRSAAKTSGLAI